MNKCAIQVSMIIVVLLVSCAPPPTATPAPSATASQTSTDIPTDTPTATPNYLATEEAEATQAADVLLQELQTELGDLGISIDGSVLAYVQEFPVEIAAKQQNFDGEIKPLDDDTLYGDFVMGVDITWETDTGLSGCGIIFRSERDIERGEQMRLQFSRLSGAPLWLLGLYNYGQGQAPLVVDGNTAMRSEQGSTNHFIIVTRGLDFTIYANGVRMGGSTLPEALSKGRFGFLTWEDSGKSTCTFANTWILELPKNN